MTSTTPAPDAVPAEPAAPARATTAAWLVPTMIYVVALGGLGVTSKLALKHLKWEDLIFWSGVGYSFVVAYFLATGIVRPKPSVATAWAIASAVLAIGGLVALYIALDTGQASKVVPISAAYPAVTLIFSAIFLGERLSLARAFGVALVVGGVVVITTL
ncbi:EamA family transporter [Baekduia soli]|uniref:EamA family transporter n=1 Tax=Baekduia soli TaxID=496014 RepID=A0A5B8UAP8_9ACTN|nr:EamA family transporter [Baekduia soli]QEC49878.1 EamA family transporter [Baekduia soli]